MQILMISHHFASEPNCITSELAYGLSRRCHDVHVVATHPNCPFGKFYTRVNPWFPKYSRVQGIKILRYLKDGLFSVPYCQFLSDFYYKVMGFYGF